MADREGGQWNVATKDDAVYVERVSDNNEKLFDDWLEPHEARQLARLLTKYADKLDESQNSESSNKSDDSEKAEDSDKSDKAEDSDKSDKSEDSDKSDKSEDSDESDKSEDSDDS